MITLDVRSNLKGVMRQLNSFERQYAPIATAKALTFTAEKVRDAERVKMESVFDRPTRWTLNSMYLKTATLRSMVAAVYFKDENAMKVGSGTPGAVYMLPQIHGGTRPIKPFERRLSAYMAGHRYAMPGAGMVLNRHGNIPAGQITKILSQVKALGNYQDQTPATRKRNKRKGGVEYFWPKPGSGLKPGIYKRQGRRIMPALIFTSRATYRPRFPFYEFGIAVARVQFPILFEKALEREMRRAFTPVAVAA